MRLADAKGIGVDAVLAAYLFELDGVFALKEEQRMAHKAFLHGKNDLSFSSNWPWQEFR